MITLLIIISVCFIYGLYKLYKAGWDIIYMIDEDFDTLLWTGTCLAVAIIWFIIFKLP